MILQAIQIGMKPSMNIKHGTGEIAERIDMREAFIGRGRLSPQHEARNDHAEESAIAVHRDSAHRIVDLEAALDEVVQLVGR